MSRILFLASLLALAACSGEPENIQAKAENLSRELENEANALEAESANDVDAAAAPLEKEAEALLNQTVNSVDTPANQAGNAAR